MSEAKASKYTICNRDYSIAFNFSEMAVLIVISIELLILYVPTFGWLFERWTMSVWHHAHGLFIPPIVTYLIWQRLRCLRHLPRQSSAWGFAILVPALVLHMLDVGIHTQLLSAVSLVLVLPGLSLLFLGLQRTKAIAFVLLFLVFMLPIPLALTKSIHLFLREITTANIALIVPMLGIPVFIEGTTVSLPNTILQVADACSGFSTLYAVTAMACLAAYLSPVSRRWPFVMLAAAPVAIVVNTMRVVLLFLLVFWRGVDVLETWLHPISGVVTIVLGFTAIFWISGITSPLAGRR